MTGRKKQWVILGGVIIPLALALGVPAFARSEKVGPVDPDWGVASTAATVPATTVEPGLGDGPTPFPRSGVTLLQGLNTWLTGAVWVQRVPGGFAYHECYDTRHLEGVLGSRDKVAAVQAMGSPAGSRALAATMNGVRPEFERLVVEYESPDFHFTDAELSTALREMVLGHEATAEVKASVRAGIEAVGAVPGEEFSDTASSVAATSCTSTPCCLTSCGSDCTKHRCDCGVCGDGRVCSCQHAVSISSCVAPASNCNTDSPAALRTTPSLGMGW